MRRQLSAGMIQRLKLSTEPFSFGLCDTLDHPSFVPLNAERLFEWTEFDPSSRPRTEIVRTKQTFKDRSNFEVFRRPSIALGVVLASESSCRRSWAYWFAKRIRIFSDFLIPQGRIMPDRLERLLKKLSRLLRDCAQCWANRTAGRTFLLSLMEALQF